MLNILIRTSEREDSFARLIDDIVNQTIDKSLLRVLVSQDTDKEYPERILSESGLSHNIIRVDKGSGDGFYNLYLNDLLKEVNDGWVLIIDDDDFIYGNNALEVLYRQLRDRSKIYLFKILLDGIHEIPRKAEYGKSGVVRGQISMSGFSIHSSQIGKVWFEQTRGGDYYFVMNMLKKIQPKWINHIVVSTGNLGLKGKMVDEVNRIGKIWYFTPYALDGNFGRELNEYMELIGDDDVAVIMDGDTMFLQSDFGHTIHRVLGKYPLGVYTCLTNRVQNKQQLYKGKISNNRDIVYHKKISAKLSSNFAYNVKQGNAPFSGMLLVVPKKIWREFPFGEGGILGIDWDFTERVSKKYPLYVMQGLYILHYYRLVEGVKYTKHLR